ncbi:MAG: hypothetical protein ACRDZR_14510, partial [Acidimicrobiales bacterium]
MTTSRSSGGGTPARRRRISTWRSASRHGQDCEDLLLTRQIEPARSHGARRGPGDVGSADEQGGRWVGALD